jgi:4-amino-4-deoxy-L-arabinose transferase-like glycosyltransferase
MNILISSKLTKLFSSSYLILGIIIFFSIFPRIWNLTTKPPLIVDEPANIRDINLILQNGLNITDFHWDYSKSRVVHLLPVLLIKSGITDKFLALRFSSVILSLASLVPFFLISKRITGKLVAFCTTILFSYSYYYLEFSRVGWTDVIMNIFLGLSLFFILIKLKESSADKIILSVIGGLIAALIFYSYRSGIILLGVALVFLLFKNKNVSFKVHIMKILIFITTFFLTSLPWINKISLYKEKYNLRLSVVSINNVVLPHDGLTTKQELITDQIEKTVGSWILLNRQVGLGNENPRYLPQNYPIVNVFIKIGFWLGLLIGLLNLKKTYPLYIIILMGMSGQILTVDPPNGARGLIMIPVVYLFFSLGIYTLLKHLNKVKFASLALIVLTSIFSFADFEFYKYWMTWIKV